jgi:hypothetical protein
LFASSRLIKAYLDELFLVLLPLSVHSNAFSGITSLKYGWIHLFAGFLDCGWDDCVTVMVCDSVMSNPRLLMAAL